MNEKCNSSWYCVCYRKTTRKPENLYIIFICYKMSELNEDSASLKYDFNFFYSKAYTFWSMDVLDCK